MKNRKPLVVSYLVSTAILIVYVFLLKASVIPDTTYIKVGVFISIIAIVGYGFMKSRKEVS